MARRGHNEGSIYKAKDGRWVGALTVEGGKRKYFYGKTRQQVQTKLASAKRDVERGLSLGDERQTLGEYLPRWMATMRPSLRPSSIALYETILRVHVIPALGAIRMAKLTPQQVQMFYVERLASGRSSSRVQLMHGVLHRALRDAVRLSLVPRNVTELVSAPRRRAVTIRTWTVEEAKTFLRHCVAVDERLIALYMLALNTGMRAGEIGGLQWQYVDLARRTLQVRTALVYLNGEFQMSEPKTAAGRRLITLSVPMVTALREHRRRQHEERLSLGAAWQDHGLVFCREDGFYLGHSYAFRRHFKSLARQANVPVLHFHKLRHTAASLALADGQSVKEVSERLGHAKTSMTSDIYAHVQPGLQGRVSERLGEMLFG